MLVVRKHYTTTVFRSNPSTTPHVLGILVRVFGVSRRTCGMSWVSELYGDTVIVKVVSRQNMLSKITPTQLCQLYQRTEKFFFKVKETKGSRKKDLEDTMSRVLSIHLSIRRIWFNLHFTDHLL